MSMLSLLRERFVRQEARMKATRMQHAAAQWAQAVKWLDEVTQSVDLNLDEEPRAWEISGLHAVPAACRTRIARSARDRDLIVAHYEALGLKVTILPLHAPKTTPSLITESPPLP